MGRDYQARLLSLQTSEVVERSNVLRAAPEIEQERMTAFDRALHSRNQNDSPVGGVVGKWTDIELDAANGKKLGYLFVREGKSKNARRHVSLTPRAQDVLVNRSLESKSEYVFANQWGEPYLVTSLDHLHKKLR